MTTFLATLTGQSRAAIFDVVAQLTITTQVTIERDGVASTRQRPDMMVWVGSQPWLLFENKVAHKVDETEADDLSIESQLHRYGKWLGDQPFNAFGLTKALVFVTHHTSVPADFLDQNNEHPAYAGLDKIPSSWGHLAKILAEATATLESSSLSRGLVEAYKAYLEQRGMANEYPRYRDLASLSAFIEVSDGLEKLVSEMYRRVDRISATAGNTAWAAHSSDEGTFSAYRYLAATPKIPAKSFVQTGIWFPDLSDGWFRDLVEQETGQQVTSSAKVFLLLANDDDNMLSSVAHPGDGWLQINSDLLLFRDFASFGREANDRAHAIIAWIDTEGGNLKRALGG
ncbi:MAG: hypothetical protein JWL96_1921 [Sphingomonas bacterium]|uniref:hypothetical protein n=1 Tax=Sphingomonas bacterium TaxID=1895847 RepID=UPI00261FB15A|nr:hypothetical protein [Sphingomonas bacterium]MDB5709851.1 hypothetical protein [Sphingomonas bacterium]